jgi:hypothetical protein
VTLERIFAYYCRCIKNEPERFKFREAIGPKEYAIFCQECQITGDAKGKLSIIDSRRVFKRANMEVRRAAAAALLMKLHLPPRRERLSGG